MNQLLDDPDFNASALGAEFLATPLGFVDVGARGGVHPIVEAIAGVTAVLAFEPDQEECRRMRNELAGGSPWARLDLVEAAISDRHGPATIYLYAAASNNSLLPTNETIVSRYEMAKFKVVGTSSLNTTTLDKILFESRNQENFWGEFLKLDTQGTEFEVLQGGARTLDDRTVAIVAEVWFCEVYKGQRLFSEVETLLRAKGFRFYGLASTFERSRKGVDKRWHAGQERLLYGDAVFLKDPFDSRTTLAPRAAKVLFLAALLLGYLDFALEVALSTWATGVEAQRIKAMVERFSHLPPQDAVDDSRKLLRRIESDPGAANIAVGRFVDDRRARWNYRDVTGES